MTRCRPAALATLAWLLAAGTPLAGTPGDGPDAIETMLSVRESPKALDKAIKDARAAGASDQAVIEARFLYHVDRREDAALAAMLPGMLAQAPRFKLADSEIFAVEEDWLAVLEYVKAIAALEKNDRAGFKTHITEAFWLSPRQGAAFAPHIERVRLAEAMKSIRVDDSREFRDLNGTVVPLGKLRNDAKAMLLHFFSPWSRECEEGLNDLRAVTRELKKHGIPVIGLVGEGGDTAVADTTELLTALEQPAPGAWLVDPPEDPLSRLLRVQSAPTMVLVAGDGRVLFNGHPADGQLWEELGKLAPGLQRPPASGGSH